MKYKDIKAVIFDCDGVMLDSSRSNTEYYNIMLKHFDKPALTKEQYLFVSANTALESIKYLFGEKYEIALEFAKSIDYKPLLDLMYIEPDLKPLLKSLRPKYKTAVATNRSSNINLVVEKFGLKEFFDIIVSSVDVKRPKPYPDSLEKVMETFKIAPKQAIYIGDSDLDQKAAKSCGTNFIAYRGLDLLADFHITRLRQIKDILL